MVLLGGGNRVINLGMISAGLAAAREALAASGRFGRQKSKRGYQGPRKSRFSASLYGPRRRRTKSERQDAQLLVSLQDERNRERVAKRIEDKQTAGLVRRAAISHKRSLIRPSIE